MHYDFDEIVMIIMQYANDYENEIISLPERMNVKMLNWTSSRWRYEGSQDRAQVRKLTIRKDLEHFVR